MLRATAALCVLCLHVALAATMTRPLRLREGSGHQGSDLNAKDPSGIWSTFQRVGGDDVVAGNVGTSLRTVANVWGQGACLRRSQSEIAFRLTAPENVTETGEVVALCVGWGYCEKQAEGHHFLCQCEKEAVTPVEIAFNGGDAVLLKATGVLEPGQYQLTLQKGDGEAEVLQGMDGVEEFRPLTVMPKPASDAVLLMSDIDGTLLGDEESTDKFFWIWDEQYKPRGAHLVTQQT